MIENTWFFFAWGYLFGNIIRCIFSLRLLFLWRRIIWVGPFIIIIIWIVTSTTAFWLFLFIFLFWRVLFLLVDLLSRLRWLGYGCWSRPLIELFRSFGFCLCRFLLRWNFIRFWWNIFFRFDEIKFVSLLFGCFFSLFLFLFFLFFVINLFKSSCFFKIGVHFSWGVNSSFIFNNLSFQFIDLAIFLGYFFVHLRYLLIHRWIIFIIWLSWTSYSFKFFIQSINLLLKWLYLGLFLF